MILGSATLAGSSSLFGRACTYRIANFSLGGLNIGPLGETGYVCHSPQFRPTDLRRKGRIVTWWWPFSHSPSEKSRGSGKHHDGSYYREHQRHPLISNTIDQHQGSNHRTETGGRPSINPMKKPRPMLAPLIIRPITPLATIVNTGGGPKTSATKARICRGPYRRSGAIA